MDDIIYINFTCYFRNKSPDLPKLLKFCPKWTRVKRSKQPMRSHMGVQMTTQPQLVLTILLFALFGCASTESRFFDSAMNDRNRAPASLQLPTSYDQAIPVIDSLNNQAEADFLFLRADIESLQGNSVESIENLKSALVYDPQSATLMQRLSIEYFRRSQVRDSLYWAERAKVVSADRRDLNMLLGGLYSSTKNYDKAVSVYEGILKQNPEDYEVMLYLGAIFSEQKNYKKAALQFQKVAGEKESTSRHLAHYYLARIYIEQNEKLNAKKAQLELRKSIQLRPEFFEAISLLAQLIQKESGAAASNNFYITHQAKHGPQAKLAEILSQYYIEKSQYDKAYEQLEILDSQSEDQVQIKLKMALILIDKKMYDLAIEKLDDILKIAPESDKVRFYLSAVFEEKKQFQQAFDQYMLISKSSSYFEESRVHAAYLSKILGDSNRGQKVLSEVEKITNVQTYFLMAQFHEDKSEIEKAIQVAKKAQTAFPKNAQAHFYEGTLLDKLNKKREMLSSMELALALDPNNTQTMNYIAFSLAELNEDLEKAEKLARSAVQNDKDDGFVLDTLGWILFKRGDYKEAIRILEKAHEIQPGVGIIAEHLGDAYIKLKKLDKARVLLLKANELESDQSRKRDIQTKLTVLEDDLKIRTRKPASVDGDLKTNESP